MRCLLLLVALVGAAHAIGEGALSADAFTGILSGIGRMFETVETEEVEEPRLMGRWFQMYKAAINFDVFRTQMFCPVAYFKPNSVMGNGGFTIEEAYRVISKTGPIEVYKRDVSKVKEGSYMMYTEEYFYPSQFVIIGAGPRFKDSNETEGNRTLAEDVNTDGTDYEYIIATDANRLRLEVYARDPIAFYQKYNKEVLEFVKERGFGGGAFWNAPQPIYQGPDCEWPTEKEVFARRVLRNQQQAQQRATQQSGAIQPSGLASSIFGGINPSGVVNTFQGLFGQRPAQPQFASASQQNTFNQPQRIGFQSPPRPAQQSIFLNNGVNVRRHM